MGVAESLQSAPHPRGAAPPRRRVLVAGILLVGLAMLPSVEAARTEVEVRLEPSELVLAAGEKHTVRTRITAELTCPNAQTASDVPPVRVRASHHGGSGDPDPFWILEPYQLVSPWQLVDRESGVFRVDTMRFLEVRSERSAPAAQQETVTWIGEQAGRGPTCSDTGYEWAVDGQSDKLVLNLVGSGGQGQVASADTPFHPKNQERSVTAWSTLGLVFGFALLLFLQAGRARR